MTAITPENGFRARARRLARGTVVFAIALGLCAGSGAAAAQGDDEQGSVSLDLSVGPFGTVVQGSTTTASVSLTNDTEQAVPAGDVVVELNRTPLTDRVALSDWLEADDDGKDADFTALASDSFSSADPGDTVTTTVPIPADSLGDLAPGVYPVRASLVGTASDDDEQTVRTSATSVLVVEGAQRPRVGVLVPITATPEGGSLLTSDELTELTAPDGDLTAQLDGVTGTSAVLAIDPSIPAAIRVLGTSAPQSAIDWLDRLDGLPNERFELQFGDADPTTQSQAGLDALLRPTTLSPFLDPENFRLPDTPQTGVPEPTPTPPSADEPELPDDQTLSAVTGAVSGILWPRGEVTDADLAMFGTYVGRTVTTILPSSAIGSPAAAHVTVGEHDVLVTDAEASAALSRAATESDATARARSLATASAFLFLSAQAAPDAAILVGLDRDDTRPAGALRDAVSAVDTPGVGLATVRASTAAPATLADAAGDDRGTSLQLLLADESQLGSFSSILDDPQVLLSPERIRVLRTIAVGSSTSAFESAVADHREQTRATLHAVEIPPSSSIQLLTANADLPFQVRNDLPWPVSVRLSVAPSDPRLEVERITSAVIPANTNTRVKVPVSARVGSGELDLRLSLSSPTGVDIGQTQIVRVAVRAEWEGIGLTVFGALIVILIALGVIRTVRRLRREAGSGTTPDAGEDATPRADEASRADDRGVE